MKNKSISLWTFKFVKHNWRTVLLFLIPVVFSPLLFSKNPAVHCAYVIIIVAGYWVTEIMDIAITSLIPVVLFPIMGILEPENVAACYMKDITLMLIGGLIIAKTIERQNLHRRLALHILKFMGPNPIFQYLGFMLATWFISMWISNSSTTAMMITLADAVTDQWMFLATTRIKEIKTDSGEMQLSETITLSTYESEETVNDEILRTRFISKGLFLSIAYAATCGGIATVPGTPPNLVFYGYMENRYGNKIGLNFGSFMIFCFPMSLILVLFCWLLLISRYIGIREIWFRTVDEAADKKVMESIETELVGLGTVSFGEVETFVLFICLVALWILREPGVPLWGRLFIYKVNGKPVKFWTDGLSAISAALIAFNLPQSNPFTISVKKKNEKLINWSYIESGFSWGVVFLFGGGFAIADACKASGLSKIIGAFLTSLTNMPHPALILVVSIGISFLTEVTSNAVTTTILLPIMIDMAECINMHPITMGLCVTLSSSFSFCLPAATPPNAIIVSTGKVNISDMVVSGFLLNIFCVLVMTVMVSFYAIPIFGTNVFPKWLKPNCTKIA